MAPDPTKDTTNLENPMTCTSSAFADELVFPKAGGVLVIEGTRAPELMDKLALTPENDDARAEYFKTLGATYYQCVGDYLDTLMEGGGTKDDNMQEELEKEEEEESVRGKK